MQCSSAKQLYDRIFLSSLLISGSRVIFSVVMIIIIRFNGFGLEGVERVFFIFIIAAGAI